MVDLILPVSTLLLLAFVCWRSPPPGLLYQAARLLRSIVLPQVVVKHIGKCFLGPWSR